MEQWNSNLENALIWEIEIKIELLPFNRYLKMAIHLIFVKCRWFWNENDVFNKALYCKPEELKEQRKSWSRVQ
jgi:hypothetical protein